MDHGAEEEALGQIKPQSILIWKQKQQLTRPAQMAALAIQNKACKNIYKEARVKQMASGRRIT